MLFGENGKLREFINVFVGADNIRDLQGYDTPVRAGDEVMLIPAIAGGSGDTVEEPNDSVLGDHIGDKLTNDEIKRYSRHLLLLPR